MATHTTRQNPIKRETEKEKKTRKCWTFLCCTWWDRTAEEREAEEGESDGGASDQVSRSAVDVCGFLTGVVLSIFVFFFFSERNLKGWCFFFIVKERKWRRRRLRFTSQLPFELLSHFCPKWLFCPFSLIHSRPRLIWKLLLKAVISIFICRFVYFELLFFFFVV